MPSFPTTQWGCVAEAIKLGSPEAGTAMADLCRSYWYPIYLFIRSRGHSSEESADLTQEYFRRLLEGRLLAVADREKGRFRSLLRVDCEYFLADHRDLRRARKRGGTRPLVSLDVEDAEGRYCIEPSKGLSPERLFDRAWAFEILARALERLGREEAEAGRGAMFDLLKPLLADGPGAEKHAVLATRIGATVATVRSALQRLRGRYRAELRAEVASTLGGASGDDVEDEIRTLFEVLAR